MKFPAFLHKLHINLTETSIYVSFQSELKQHQDTSVNNITPKHLCNTIDKFEGKDIFLSGTLVNACKLMYQYLNKVLKQTAVSTKN